MEPLSNEQARRLTETALNVRRNILRQIKAGAEGHIGGALSAVEILTALYFHVMRVNPHEPLWTERDRFILSAGHKCMALYAVLAEKGYFDVALLDTYGALDSRLPGHPDMERLSGVETNTGALGHGLSIAGGMALGLKMDRLDAKVYVLMGDGEAAEGSNWEAAAACCHYRLDNLLLFIDRNHLQVCGPTQEIMDLEPLRARWEAFGWSVRAIDGHNLQAIVQHASAIPFEVGKPSALIANTVKAKGLSFAEGRVEYHYWKASPEELALAARDLHLEDGE